MNHDRARVQQRQRRAWRVRKRIRGTAQRPRLAVFRSHKHICAQLIDDASGRTLAAASTVEEELRGQIKYGGNRTAAEAVGRTVAERALAAGVKQVAFDRGSFQYHGRVAALAEAARKAGLDF
ncbi:MAG TPA: 50S ribosomal protein L18 [Pirellulales bacterium]|nr:50S ribosomal protein L18 [Pirellulales bacterium]